MCCENALQCFVVVSVFVMCGTGLGVSVVCFY